MPGENKTKVSHNNHKTDDMMSSSPSTGPNNDNASTTLTTPVKKAPYTGPTSELYRRYQHFVIDSIARFTGIDIPNVNHENSRWPNDYWKMFLKRFIFPRELAEQHLQDTNPLLQVLTAIALTMIGCCGFFHMITHPTTWVFGFSIAALMTLHSMEWIMLAMYQTDTSKMRYPNFAFLKLTTGYYVIIAEYCMWTAISFLYGWNKGSNQAYWAGGATKWISFLGAAIMLIGQFYRSLAMYQCGFNFQYALREKREAHNHLVTNGIFSALRHPSYIGMSLFGFGLCILLQTPITFLAFICFNLPILIARIELEEEKLIGMYGDEYLKYRETTPALLPNENIFKLSTYAS